MKALAVGKQHSMGANDLYMSYRAWAGARNEETVPSSVFSSDMLHRGFSKTRIGKGVMYHGLALQGRPDHGPSIRPGDFQEAV